MFTEIVTGAPVMNGSLKSCLLTLPLIICTRKCDPL